MAKTIEISGGGKQSAHLAKLSRNLSKATTLRAGFLEGATYPDGTSVATVAALNNFGTGKMPPRPFFSVAVATHGPEWPGQLGKLLGANNYDASIALNLMGQIIVSEIEQSIIDFDSVPLAPATIRAKGFDKQLVDKGIMLRSANSEVT